MTDEQRAALSAYRKARRTYYAVDAHSTSVEATAIRADVVNAYNALALTLVGSGMTKIDMLYAALDEAEAELRAARDGGAQVSDESEVGS